MEKNVELFSEIEIDAIGEILNIGMGASATSASGMLDQRVTITTPRVIIQPAQEFHFESFEPAVGVEINYTKGLSGTSIMILRESDIRVIVGLLLGTTLKEEDFAMDEMSVSAICEVMNQMMGSSATALSEFLSRSIHISTPSSFLINSQAEFKEKYCRGFSSVVTVYFNLMIGDLVNSEFISVLSVDLAKELVANLSVNHTENLPMPDAPPPPAQRSSPATPPPAEQARVPFAAAPEAWAGAAGDWAGAAGDWAGAAGVSAKSAGVSAKSAGVSAKSAGAWAEAAPAHEPTPVSQPGAPGRAGYVIKEASIASFDREKSVLSEDQATNLNLIMAVPLQITVEIGRTKRQIKDILEFTSGTIVELNKQAGSQVDIFANGQRFAKGDVVVVEDFYGVRITEILSKSEIMKII